MVIEAEKVSDLATWDHHVQKLPNSHILQSWQWGLFKQDFGWGMNPFILKRGGRVFAENMLLKRSLSIGRIKTPLSILYSPRGPILDWQNEEDRGEVFNHLEEIAKSQAVISVKIDPEIILGTGKPGGEDAEEGLTGLKTLDEIKMRGWQYSPAQVQFRNTMWLDLEADEEQLLADMKQKTRYNIRLAVRKGVTVRKGSVNDISSLYRIYLETSLRDGFVIRSRDYYMTLWERFVKNGLAHVLLAEYGDELLSGLILFQFGDRSWYFYGMSNQAHREKMPNYLIQWEAIRLAKRLNCKIYDFWGAPEHFDESDGMWGVYKFKEGFGGKIIRTPGAWDFAPRKAIYSMFVKILPRLLDVMRKRRVSRATQEIGP